MSIQTIYGLKWDNMILPGQVSGFSIQIITFRRNNSNLLNKGGKIRNVSDHV